MRPTPAFLLALTLVAGTWACGAQSAPAPDGRGLELQPDDGPLARGVKERDARLNFHDFGRVPDGDTVAHVFRLVNTDPRPVAITRVDPGCGCTVAELRVRHADGSVERGLSASSKEERLLSVPPGDTAEIEVAIATRNVSNKNVDKLVTVRVLTDSPNGYFITLEVHILVEQPFTVVPAKLFLGDVPENGGGVSHVDIVPAGPLDHELTELGPVPPEVEAELTHELRNGIQVWTLTARLLPPLPRGNYSSTLRVGTRDIEGNPGRDVEVPLFAQVVADVRTDPTRLVFAAPREGVTRASCELASLLAGQRLRVRAVEVRGEGAEQLAVSYEPVEPDDGGTSDRWRITLETRPPLGPQEMLRGVLDVALDDPQHPRLEIDYVVHLR